MADAGLGPVTSGLPHYSENPDVPVYFYGGELSSFWGWQILAYPMKPLAIPVEQTFSTREHWFAAHKTLIVEQFEAVRREKGPREAKRLGRQMTLREGWDDGLSFAVMVEGIRYQAKHHLALRDKLLATGDRLIAEDSPTDFIWGIRSPGGGMEGRNLLGKAWMTVRAELQYLAKTSGV